MSSENVPRIPKKLPLLFIPGGVVLPGVSVRFKITSARGWVRYVCVKTFELANRVLNYTPSIVRNASANF